MIRVPVTERPSSTTGDRPAAATGKRPGSGAAGDRDTARATNHPHATASTAACQSGKRGTAHNAAAIDAVMMTCQASSTRLLALVRAPAATHRHTQKPPTATNATVRATRRNTGVLVMLGLLRGQEGQ